MNKLITKHPDNMERNVDLEISNELAELELDKACGAWIRSRFQYANDSDKPIKYLYDLERKKRKTKTLHFLTLANGRNTDSEEEINDITKAFYTDLCKNKICHDIIKKN